MKIVMFSSQPYDHDFFDLLNKDSQHDIHYLPEHLNNKTAQLAKGYPVVCCFVNDHLDADVLKILADGDTKLIALRSAGYDHVDLSAAKKLNLVVARVPAYSPNAVAEHAVGLMLDLNRKIHRAYNRIREGNFSLEGLLGFDVCDCTVGVIGTGKIGTIFARILCGFGSKVIAVDPIVNEECKQLGVEYVTLPELYQRADIISLHCPLTPDTHHLINQQALVKMKPGVMIINTSRGAVLDTKAIIAALKTKHIGYLGIDVYEEEGDLFFEDLSNQVIDDDTFARLQTFPNVLITGHQGFFTKKAVHNIAEITLQNITAFETGQGNLYTINP